MEIAEKKEKVKGFYDELGAIYDEAYEENKEVYAANLYRIEMALDTLDRVKAYRVLDAGCGTGYVTEELIRRGYKAEGFDFSKSAIVTAKQRVGDLAKVGDMEDPDLYAPASFDAVLCIGPFGHPNNVTKTLANFRKWLVPNGIIIVELRNELFSLFTLNTYSEAFYRDRLMSPSKLAEDALKELKTKWYPRVGFKEQNPLSQTAEKHSTIPTVWNNPLTIDGEYASHGFQVIDKMFYHWHAVPPVFESLDKAEFRRLSQLLERRPHDWRGHFMASAFLVVARNIA